jgi:FtsP/CotA-like multicopper oxidase with cupredoxin domain
MPTIARPIVDPAEYEEFGCHPFEDSPITPDRVSRNVFFRRQVADFGVTMADGTTLPFWGFKDPDISGGDRVWPSKLIRVKQGQIVHCEFKPAKNTHTIHWHGIEPTPHNDGVGHTSFEVKSEYTYQWMPHQAGTYLYHCHKNTVLHFEMGMYGVLIVDPVGTGTAPNPKLAYDPWPGDSADGIQAGAPYATESILVFDDIDPRWHTLDHNAGMCGDDVGLDRFEPKYFVISGVPNNKTQTDARTAVKAKVGTNVLVRLANASYSCLGVKLPVDAWVVEIDGRPLRYNPGRGSYSKPYKIPANNEFELATAQRYALWIPNITAGSHSITGTFRHWVTNKMHPGGQAIAKIIAQ